MVVLYKASLETSDQLEHRKENIKNNSIGRIAVQWNIPN